MSATLDTNPDPDVAAVQTIQAHILSAARELHPLILRIEQRQRARELAREAAARKAQTPTQIDTLPADDRKRA